MLCGQCVFAPYVGWLIVGGVPVFVNQCVPLLAVDLALGLTEVSTLLLCSGNSSTCWERVSLAEIGRPAASTT